MFEVADDDSTRHTDQIICDQQSLCYYVSQVLMDTVFVSNRETKKFNKNKFYNFIDKNFINLRVRLVLLYLIICEKLNRIFYQRIKESLRDNKKNKMNKKN